MNNGDQGSGRGSGVMGWKLLPIPGPRSPTPDPNIGAILDRCFQWNLLNKNMKPIQQTL